MKRYRVFSILSATVLMTATAYAQITTASGQQPAGAPSAWWTDTALMTRLGLSEVQKARIENIFQTHRQNLTTSKDALEKEEAQLSKLLAADPIDRPSVFAEINKVIQARSDMERVNATMTLEMREQLTPAQWTQLQTQPTGQRGGRGGLGRGAINSAAAALTYAADKSITLEGRVAALNLAEPRSAIVIEVAGNDGKTTRWTGEMAGFGQLTQQGWTRSSLTVGEKVIIEGSPSRDPSENAVLIRTVRKVPEQR